jgi:pimeloyl-ACP methyl ester carboxylesterase
MQNVPLILLMTAAVRALPPYGSVASLETMSPLPPLHESAPHDDHIEHRVIVANGIRFHVATAGPEDGPLVMMLHGFPEAWFGWRKQMQYLARRGWRVWVPDQRGYNLTEKPPGVEAYAIDVLAADLLALIDAAGQRTAHVVAHDWGAAVAWYAALVAPHRLNRMVIANVPHPAVMKKTLLTQPQQTLRSWYIYTFQVPWLAERVLEADRYRLMAKLLRSASKPGTFSNEDLGEYQQAWSHPGALTSMLNWYRAMVRHWPPLQKVRVRVPTLVIWGEKDVALVREMAPASVALCDQGELRLIADAGHFVQHEEAEKVSAWIHGYLSGEKTNNNKNNKNN